MIQPLLKEELRQELREEQFEIFSHEGKLLGECPRSRVHAEGMWHKSSQVFLYNAHGALYLQRRSLHKDICGGLWDASVAEHLTPGESYLAAALRGLVEELAVSGVRLTEVGAASQLRVEFPELQIKDYEFRQVFRGEYEGHFTLEPDEVDEIRLVGRAELRDWIASQPEAFTPWLLHDLKRHSILTSRWGNGIDKSFSPIA